MAPLSYLLIIVVSEVPTGVQECSGVDREHCTCVNKARLHVRSTNTLGMVCRQLFLMVSVKSGHVHLTINIWHQLTYEIATTIDSGG